jgi:site-specific DNA recombinase
MSTRAALYLRVSTSEQAENGHGLDVQRERCKALVVVKGWQVVAEFSDEGVSGTLGIEERVGLKALMQAIESGDIDAVIVLALDRLARSTLLILDLVSKITAKGVTIASCKESLDTSTPTGQFVLTMFAALAQLERDTIVERTTAGRNARGKKDGEKGGSVPYGYVRALSESALLVDEKAAQVVRKIFSMRNEGLTLRSIADALNEQDIPSPKGKKWYASSVKSVLSNEEAYRGGTRGDSDTRWPKILD